MYVCIEIEGIFFSHRLITINKYKYFKLKKGLH